MQMIIKRSSDQAAKRGPLVVADILDLTSYDWESFKSKQLHLDVEEQEYDEEQFWENMIRGVQERDQKLAYVEAEGGVDKLSEQYSATLTCYEWRYDENKPALAFTFKDDKVLLSAPDDIDYKHLHILADKLQASLYDRFGKPVANESKSKGFFQRLFG